MASFPQPGILFPSSPFSHLPHCCWNLSCICSEICELKESLGHTYLICPLSPVSGMGLDYGRYLLRLHCARCSLILSLVGTCPETGRQPLPTSPTSLSPLSQRESCGSVRRLGRWPRLRKMVKSRPMRSAATPEYNSSPADRARAAQDEGFGDRRF